ncbi:hypothetical protein SAY86_016447 [Trapa natans]|uniref:Thymidylate kinase-like domain-containing protein n=1 Tax=Trapa natans TaxID=22666 RepID=A0AAN7QZW7_TRANT|nr:hypothetical protein SAY86_016447 [Trapa natans]
MRPKSNEAHSIVSSLQVELDVLGSTGVKLYCGCMKIRSIMILGSGWEKKALKFSNHLSCKYCAKLITMSNNPNDNLKILNKEGRGALIVLEGLDRSGKTSQSTRLLSYLEGLGHSVELWRFPDRTTSVGKMISSYLSNESQLDDRTIHLLFSANRWEKKYALLTCVTIYFM